MSNERGSNPLRTLREEVLPEHATRGELNEVKVTIGLVALDVAKVKDDISDLKSDMALVKAAVIKPDGRSMVDMVPSRLEKNGIAGTVLLLVILTVARMLGLQLPSP